MGRLEDYALRIIAVYNVLAAYPSRGDAFTPKSRSGYRSNKLRCHAALTPQPPLPERERGLPKAS